MTTETLSDWSGGEQRASFPRLCLREGLGKAKLTVSLGASHQVLIIYFLKHPGSIKLFSGTKYLLKDNFDNPRNLMSC